jgi:hypothetical protein
MENLNSIAEEIVSAPIEAGESVPQSAPTPEAVPVAVVAATPVAPAPVVVPSGQIIKGELPKTTGTTPGGWNRFAGYDPKAAKDKKNDRRDGKGRK